MRQELMCKKPRAGYQTAFINFIIKAEFGITALVYVKANSC